MALSKVVCPKCGKVLTIDPKSYALTCPICGASLFDKPLNLPPLDVRYDITALDDFLSDGFKFLYFRAYDKLFELSSIMVKLYPDNFYSYLFNLIGKTEIDFIFLLKDVNMSLTDEEIEDDIRSRYYHYARKKYSKSPQSVFEKISGHYPDLPSEKRGKWEKARTKYDENLELVDKYLKISNEIHMNYLENFVRTANNEDEQKILENIKVWMDQVAHAHLDFYRYNSQAEELVVADYNSTPTPGNTPKFTAYLIMYILGILTIILGATDISVAVISGSTMGGLYGYLSTGTNLLFLTISLVVYIISADLFYERPILATTLIVLLVILSASSMLTANIKTNVNWFSILSIVIAIVIVFFSIFKCLQYFPRRRAKSNTIIGDLAKLRDNSFKVDFHFQWKKYEGKRIAKLKFKEEWLSGN